jgi:PAS domain S-box-containing protein
MIEVLPDRAIRKIVENFEEAIFLLDEEGVILSVSSAAGGLTGFKTEELLQKEFKALFHPDDLGLIEELTQQPQTLEARLVAKKGIVRVRIRSEHLSLTSGKIVLVVVTELGGELDVRDFYASPVGVYLIQDGVFEYVNSRVAELWGFTREEIIGENPLKFIHPADREAFKRIEKLDEFSLNLRVVGKDGKVRINEFYGSKISYRGKKAIIGTLFDITAFRSYREELERYKRFYENAQDLFFILDSKARFVDVNPKYAQLLGYRKEELIGHTARRFFHPSEVEIGREMFRRVMRGEKVRYEVRAIPRDKKNVYFIEIILWPIVENNRIVGAEGIVRDITEKKKLEEKLRKSEEKYRLIVESSRDVIKVVSKEGIRLYISPSAEKVFGYKPEEMIGKSIFEYVHPADVERVKAEFKSAIENKRAGKAVYRYKKKDGSWIWAESVGTPIIKNGEVEGGVIVTRDITNRIELEEKLRKSEEKYRKMAEYLQKLIEVAPIPITSWDSKYRITGWNKAAEDYFGWKAEEVLGKNLLEFQVPEEERERVKKLLDSVEEGAPVININPTLTKDGERRIFEWYNFAIGRGEEKITTSIGVDLTERIEMEKMLAESEEKFRKIFETSPSLVAVIAEDGTFIEANPAMIKSIGINPVGKNLKEVFPPDVAEKRLKKIKEVISKNERIDFEDSKGGRYFSSTFLPITLKGKKHCLVLARDITQYLKLNRLLGAINKVNKLMVYEKDRDSLLEKACEVLSNLTDYHAFIVLLENDETGKISGKGICTSSKTLPCFSEVIVDAKVIRGEEGRRICPYHREYFLSCTIVPMRDGNVRGFVVVQSKESHPEKEEIEMIKTLADDLAFAIKAIELDESRKKAYKQIEKNIEQFAILVDQIRNPLAIIAGLAEIKASEELRREIAKQVEKIERLIKKLDTGWLESERVKEFLRRT